MRIFVFVSLASLCLLPEVCPSQNLVTNGSFEDHSNCPKTFSEIENATGWMQPTTGTTDLFSSCAGSYGYVGVPSNGCGYQQAHTGNSYAGIYCYAKDDPNYREYLEAQLSSPLMKGKKYSISFYLSLADYSHFSIDKIGVVFSNKKMNIKTDGKVSGKPLYNKKVLPNDTDNWFAFTETYLAHGGENFLIIGAFDYKTTPVDPGKSPKKFRSMNRFDQYAYYFIDEISVELIDTKPAHADSVTAATPARIPHDNNPAGFSSFSAATQKHIVLQNVLFETDKSTLLPTSFSSLDSLADFLSQNKNSTVTLFGYTDNTGDEIKNANLSQARAKAVGDYLAAKGIDEKRIICKGCGSSQPIASNDTDNGKKLNRRVEMKISMN